MVTRNLWIALKHLRYANETRYLWVDAVCINQNKISERNAQVALMGNVYARASRVIVWLGPKKKNSDHTMKLLKYISRRVKCDDPATEKLTLTDLGKDSPELLDPSALLPWKDEVYIALGRLFHRPWFKRLWVRQELGMSDQATFQCGTMTIEWPELICAILVIARKPHELISTADLALLCRLTRVRHQSYTYDDLCLDCGILQCTDRRDYIYATLNLFATAYSIEIITDYSLTHTEVFTRVCLELIEQRQTTTFLRSCEISSRSPSRSQENLPTWVPDWSRPMQVTQPFPYPWSACAWISSHAQHINSGFLRVTGVQAALVKRVFPFHMVDSDESTYGIDDALVELFRALNDVFTSKLYNFEDEDVLKRCLRTLTGGVSKDMSWPPGTTLPDLARVKEELVSFRRTDGSFDWTRLLETAGKDMRSYLNVTNGLTRGRAFFSARDGKFGLAPRDTCKGDIVCIVLGCRYPIVLRPALSNGKSYQVVGECYIEGFMNGEAIYRTFPSYYRPIFYNGRQYADVDSPVSSDGNSDSSFDGPSDSGSNRGSGGGSHDDSVHSSVDVPVEGSDGRLFNRDSYRILDTRTQKLKSGSYIILQEFGIQPKPTRYQSDATALRVTRKVLREAGIDLQKFDLV